MTGIKGRCSTGLDLEWAQAVPFFKSFGRIRSPLLGGTGNPIRFGLESFLSEVIVGMVGHDMEKIRVLNPHEITNVMELFLGDETFFGENLAFLEKVWDQPYQPL